MLLFRATDTSGSSRSLRLSKVEAAVSEEVYFFVTSVSDGSFSTDMMTTTKTNDLAFGLYLQMRLLTVAAVG